MAADGQITFDLNINDSTIKPDTERISEMFNVMGDNAGRRMDESFANNASKMSAKAAQAREKINDSLDGIKREVKTELIASAHDAGIKNFESLVNRIPKEHLTELNAKAERGEVINWQDELKKIPKDIKTEAHFNGDQANASMDELNRHAGKTEHTFNRLKDIIIGSFVGNMITNGISALTTGLKEAAQAGMEYNKQQDTMKTVWTALTTHAPEDGRVLVDYINSVANHSIYAAGTIDKMAQSFYHVHSNVGETKRWTDSFVALGSTLHMTNDALAESGEQFAKIVAGGKASAEDMSVMINRFPMFGEALQKATGKSMAQLYQMSAQGKMTATQFEQALDYLGKKYASGTQEAMTSFQGMTMYIHQRWSTLMGQVMSSSFNMSKKTSADVRNLLSDKMLTEYAHGISAALSGLMGWVANMISYINQHKDTIVDIIGDMKTIIGLIVDTVWQEFTTVLRIIGESFGIISDKGNKAKDPLEDLKDILDWITQHKQAVQDVTRAIVGMFAIKKAIEFARALKGVRDSILEIGAAEEVANRQKILDVLPGGKTGSTLGKVETASGAEIASEAAGAATIGSRVARNAGNISTLDKVAALGKTGLSTAGKGVAAFSILSSLTDLIGMNKSNAGGKTGQATGSLVGGGAGFLIGNALLPGIGGAIGSGVGSLGGEKIGELLGKQIQSGLDKNKPKASVKVIKPKDIKINMSVDDRKMNKTLDKTLKQFNKGFKVSLTADPQQAQKALDTNNKALTQMSKDVDKYYDKKHKKSTDDVQTLIKNGVITQSEGQKIWDKENKQDDAAKKKKHDVLDQMTKDTDTYYRQLYVIQHGQTAKLQELAAHGGTQTKKYQQEQQKELLNLHNGYTKTFLKDEMNLHSNVAKSLQSGAKQEESIYKQLISQKGKLNLQDLKATQKVADQKYEAAVKPAAKQRDDVVRSAKQQMNDTIKAAKKERETNSSFSKKQYDEVTVNAQKQYFESETAANKQYRSTTSAASKQHKKVSDEIESQRKDVVEKHEDQRKKVTSSIEQQRDSTIDAMFKQSKSVKSSSKDQHDSVVSDSKDATSQSSDIWNIYQKAWRKSVLGQLASALAKFVKNFGGKPIEIGAFATGTRGGSVGRDQVALTGEEGPELRFNPSTGHIDMLGMQGPELAHLSAEDHILNTTETAKAFGLNGFADGTDTILGFAKSMVEKGFDAAKNIGDDVKSFLKDPIKSIDDLIGKTLKGFVPGNTGKAGNELPPIMIKPIKDTLEDQFKKLADVFHSSDAGIDVGAQATPADAEKVIKHAMEIAGVSGDAWLHGMELIGQHESGFKNSVNNWDSNAAAGNPSAGWFQMIKTTFDGSAMAGHNNWRDPLDQAISAIRYIQSRYGGIGNVPGVRSIAHGGPYLPYAAGGKINEPTNISTAEQQPEWMLPIKGHDEVWAQAIIDKMQTDPQSLVARALGSIQKFQQSAGNFGGASAQINHASAAVTTPFGGLDSGARTNGNVTLVTELDGNYISKVVYDKSKFLQHQEMTVKTNQRGMVH